MAIRRASVDDAGALAQLRYEFRASVAAPTEDAVTFVERCTPWMVARLDNPSWRCWVADEAGGLRGCVWLHLLEKIPNPVDEPEAHAYLTNLYVQPAARGAGLGSALVRAALDECRAFRVDTVILWPTKPSRPMYERLGFAPADAVMSRRVMQHPT